MGGMDVARGSKVDQAPIIMVTARVDEVDRLIAWKWARTTT